MKRGKAKPKHIQTCNLLLLAWLDAAQTWRRMRSDPAEARCRAARAAYYAAVLGHVPPLRALAVKQE